MHLFILRNSEIAFLEELNGIPNSLIGNLTATMEDRYETSLGDQRHSSKKAAYVV